MGDQNHTVPGRVAAKRRREVALNTLEQVKEPNERQLAEIETLQKRISHVSSRQNIY